MNLKDQMINRVLLPLFVWIMSIAKSDNNRGKILCWNDLQQKEKIWSSLKQRIKNRASWKKIFIILPKILK